MVSAGVIDAKLWSFIITFLGIDYFTVPKSVSYSFINPHSHLVMEIDKI